MWTHHTDDGALPLDVVHGHHLVTRRHEPARPSVLDALQHAVLRRLRGRLQLRVCGRDV
jgi:hypothetical protein